MIQLFQHDFLSLQYIFLISHLCLILYLFLFAGILHGLFEGLIDKDETVRTAIKSSLVKILETHPARAVDTLVEYREKNPKLPEQTVIILLK